MASFNLREAAESDLLDSLEGDFGLPVELITPDGEIITTSLNGGGLLMGRVVYDQISEDLETGTTVVIGEPMVTLRRSSLSRIPLAGERWVVRIPKTPHPDAEKEALATSGDRPPEGGRSIGYIKLPLKRMVQSLEGQTAEEWLDSPIDIDAPIDIDEEFLPS